MPLFVLKLLLFVVTVSASGIYHENTKITYRPDTVSEYFGYTLTVNKKSIIVGAPKAYVQSTGLTSGAIFNCSLYVLDVSNVTCNAVDIGQSRAFQRAVMVIGTAVKDIWLGATFGFLTPDTLLACAPRFAKTSMDNNLMTGAFIIKSDYLRDRIYRPTADRYRLAFVADGSRKEYGEYGTHLSFYAYGETGMSMKITENNTVLLGAPGLLQWTGGVVTLSFSKNEKTNYLRMQDVPNTYYTRDLGPDNYLGYSVESGTFEPNGQVLTVAGAPRSKMGYGQVLIYEPNTKEQEPLNIMQLLIGPQLGAYFGASLCCLDIDGDGVTDLLVGAPTYWKGDGVFDQGAVFVYMSTSTETHEYKLQAAGLVMGSEASGAKFGTTIANLGDVDGDGFHDAAIGAPWEDHGKGAVYIYRGSPTGLRSAYTQRIVAEHSLSFGYGISKGIDIDANYCNDLMVGAPESSTVYLFRCVPTVHVDASIRVPDAMNLPHNVTSFTALFCVTVPDRPLWDHLSLEFQTKITVDSETNRAMINGESEYTIKVQPGSERCDERTVEVKPSADLSKPILILFELEAQELLRNDSEVFDMSAARVSESSALTTSFLIQLVRDCGKDMICTPLFEMTLEPLNETFIPGTDSKLGARLKVLNTEEPGYGARVNVTLPMIPKRVPSECTLQDLMMICNVPAPLWRNEDIVWEIEMEYNEYDSQPKFVNIVAELEDSLYYRNVTKESLVHLGIEILPTASFNISGKALQNTTMNITREKFDGKENITFVHFYEITNLGPSDWYDLDVIISIPENTSLSSPIKGCLELNNTIKCVWTVPAKVSVPVALPLRFELSSHGDILESNSTYNLSSNIAVVWRNNFKNSSITTTLVLDPAPPIWPLILGIVVGILFGSLLLAGIIYSLHKRGFFSRNQRERLRQLLEMREPLTENLHEESPSSSLAEGIHNEPSQELLLRDSDSD